MTYFPHKLRLNEIESYGSSSPVVILNGASGQTANLTEWQDNLDNILASVGPTGSLALGINGSASSGSVADFGNYRKTSGVRSSVIGFEDGGNVANPKFSFTTAGMGITISDYIGSHVGTIYSNNSSQLIVEKTGGSYISLESTFAAAKRLRVIEVGDQLVPSVALSTSSGFELGMYANAVGSSSARFTLSANRTSMLTVAQDSIGINNTNPSGARLVVNTGAASSVGQIIRAAASQTANLLELKNSSGTNVLGADVTGKLQLDSTANSNSLTIQSVSTGYYITAGSTALGASELHLRTGNNSDIHITPHNGGVVIGSGSYAAFNKWNITYGDVSFYKNIGNVSSIRTGFMVNSHTSTTADAETGAIRFGTAYSDSVNHYALHIVDKVTNAKVGISSTTAFDPSSLLHVQNNTAADKVLIVQGTSSQSANLTEWQDSSGTSLVSISSAGVITGGVDNSTSMLLQSLGRTWVTFKRLNDGLYSGGIRWQGSTGINGWSLGHTTQGTELRLYDATGEVVTFEQGGNVGIGSTDPGAKLEIETGAAATKGLIVQAAVSQTANLTEWQDSSGTVIAYVAADGSSSFGGTTTVGDLNIESLGTADSGTTTYNSENLTWNGSYWDGDSAENTNGVIKLATGVTENYFSLTPDDRTAGEYKFYPDELTVPGAIDVTGNATIDGNFSNGTALNTNSTSNRIGIGTTVGSSVLEIGGDRVVGFTGGDGIIRAISGTLTLRDNTGVSHTIAGGNIRLAGANYTARLSVPIGVATDRGIVIRGYTSQTANLTEWQNSSGTILSSVTKDGYVGIGMTATVPLAVNGEFRFGNMQNNAANFFIGAGGNVVINNASGQSVNDLSVVSDSGAGYSAISVSQTGVGAGLTITNDAAAATGIIVKAHASQSASITEWQNNSGTAKVLITNKGNLQINAPFNSTRSIVFNRGAMGDDSGVEFQTAGTKSWMFGHLGSTISATSNLYLTYYNGSADVSKISFNTSGRIFLGDGPNNGPQGMLEIATNAAGTKGLVVKGAASQTVNLTEWQDSSGTVMAYVAADGSSSFSESSLENPTLTGTIHIDSDSVSHGGSNLCYNGTFTQGTNGWTMTSGTATLTTETVTDARIGSKVLRAAGGLAWIIGDHSIPFDPNVLYRVEFVVRQTVDPTAGGKIFYLGVAGRDSTDTLYVNTTGANSTSAQHYIAASSQSVTEGSTWTRYIGYIKGVGATGDGTTHIDPFDPAVLHTNVKYIRPMIVANYTTGDGTFEVGYAKITAIGQSLAGLTSYGGVTGIGGNIGIGTTSPLYGIDVRGKSVNFGSVADVFDVTNGVTRFSVTPKDNSLGNYFVINQKNFSNNATSAGITVDASTNGLIAIRGFATFNGSGVQSISGRLAIANNATSTIPLTVQGIASQTANLTEWKNSSGTVLSCVDEIGRIGVGTSDPVYKLDIGSTAGTVGVRVASDTANDIFYYATGTITGNASLFSTAISATGNLTGEVKNTNTTAGSAIISTSVGGASSGDPYASFSVSGVTQWTLGIDNSDSDKFKIGDGSSPSASGTVMTITTDGNVGIGETTPGSRLQINTETAAAVGFIVKGAASQTANLTEWQNSSGTALATISSVGKLSLNNIATTGTNALDITAPTGDNGAVRKAVNVSATGGAANGYYYAYYANVTGHSHNYGLYVQNGDAYINGFLDLNNNSPRNIGNTAIGGISTTTSASLFVDDKTVGSSAGQGGDIVFRGDDRIQGSVAGVYAGIRGIKENSTYLDHKGALVFSVCPTSGPLNGTAGSKTDLTEVGRFSSDGYLGIGTTDPSSIVHVVDDAIEIQNGGTATTPRNQILFDYQLGGYQHAITTQHAGAAADNKINFNVYSGTATSNVMTLTGAGGVGIGETAPGAKLQIGISAAATKGIIVKGYASQTANLTEWQNSSGTVLASVSSSGGITGIGITSNGNMLSNGATAGHTILIVPDNVGHNYIRMTTANSLRNVGVDFINSASGVTWGIANEYSSDALVIGNSQVGNTNFGDFAKVVIKGTGNVGIGTTSPAARLHITADPDNGGQAGLVIQTGTASYYSTGFFNILDHNGSSMFRIGTGAGQLSTIVIAGEPNGNFDTIISKVMNTSTYLSYKTRFSIERTGTPYIAMELDDGQSDSSPALTTLYTTHLATTSGNVGIGNTSPGAKLQVDTGTAATKGVIVKATASQTANLTEWQNSSGTVIAYVAADGSSSFGGTTTVSDLNIESTGTADSVTTAYNSENLTWNGSYWDGAAAQNTNGTIYLAAGVTQNYFSLTPDDRTAGEYKFYPDELTTPGDIVASGIMQTTTATNTAWFEAVKPAAYQLSGFKITDGTDDFIYMQDSGTVANRVGIYSGGGRDLELKTELNASKTIRLQATTIYLTDADTPYADMVTITDGKLGIGVTPTYALSLAEGTAATAGIRFGTDTTLYRNTADSLKTDDNFTVGADLRVNSVKDITGGDWLFYYTSDDLYIGASSSGIGPVDLVVFRNSGNVGIGATAPGAKLEVETGAAGTKGLIVQGAASQTANLTEWQDSSGTVIAAVSKDGNASFGGGADASYKLTLQGTGAITQRIYSVNNGGDTIIRFDGAGYRGAIAADASYKLKINANNLYGTGAVWINNVDDSDVILVTGGGNVGVGTSDPNYKLEVNGSFAATTKSFVIDHPTKPGKKLRHGSLEGPENGVYYRGRTRSSIIELPEYWKGLVDEDSITVHLTAIGRTETPKVKSVYENIICIENETLGSIDCYFVVYGERKDVEKLQVEIDGN